MKRGGKGARSPGDVTFAQEPEVLQTQPEEAGEAETGVG